MLQVEHLTKVYDNGTVALEDVSFEIPDGQFLAVIGLSGSGKSTLLRCINRLIEPTEGRILWNGEDITNAGQEELRRIRRRIGMVFQHFNLVARSRVETNVLAGRLGYTNPALSVLNHFSPEDRALAAAALERVGLEEKRRSLASELSGGQQQRLCIARTLAPEPEVILLDEPTSALDPLATQRIEELVFELKQDYTIVIVTHNMQQAARVSDTTTFFYMGEMIEHGATKQMFTSPRHDQTEAYITGRFG